MNEIAHSFQRLLEAAKAGDWDLVDKEISSVINFHGVLWAAGRGGLGNTDENVRDFAATILEMSPKIDYPLQPDVIKLMREMMSSDKNPFVRYRLAFALWRRKIRDDAVKQLMEDAQQVSDVSDLATKYLAEK